MEHRRNSLPPENFLAVPLTLEGKPLLADLSNTLMMANATLEEPKLFEYPVPMGKEVYLFHLHFVVVDTTMEANKFGDLAELANGLKLEILTASGKIRHTFDGGLRVTKNDTWDLIAPGGVTNTPGASSDDKLTATWDMHGDEEMRLNAGDRVRCTVQDDLSTLTSLRCVVHVRVFNAPSE